jgi:hypothetical protein
MKPWQLCGTLAVGLGALVSSTLMQSPARSQAPSWLSDYETARATARQTGKPLFVAFR